MGGRASSSSEARRRPLHICTGSDGQRDDDRQTGQPIREVQQEAQRRFVGPLGVVDCQDQRPTFGDVGDEPVQAVQRGECDIACVLRRGDVGEHRFGERGRTGQ